MPVKKITIEAFLSMAGQHPVFDVRSPGEYTHAHIPGAYSLPLFSDEERKVVGTTYKQQSKQKAIKVGLDYFGVKMKQLVEEVETIVKKNSPSVKNQALFQEGTEAPVVMVHCWRGGMRSAGVAWLLDLYGFNVYTLVGGYKAYRKWVNEVFNQPYTMKVLGGFTGSNKTGVLETMETKGLAVINLEGLANHKGSAFGGIGQEPQPTQEMFENKLATSLAQINPGIGNNEPCWIEDESQRIGVLTIPHPLWKTLRQQTVFFIEIPFEERLRFIVETYGSLNKEKLVNAIIRIQKRLGPLETKTAIGFILEDNILEAFRILLAYYDKTYHKSMLNRENPELLVNKIPLDSVDSIINTEKLLSCSAANT
jgi:tRNA 2-selenouridine synthase